MLTGTFDVQKVTAAYSGTSITTTCYFATGASARGCLVHIRKEEEGGEEGSEVAEGVAKRNGTAEGGLSQTAVFVYGPDVVPGVYRVTVYDVEQEGEGSNASQPALELKVNAVELKVSAVDVSPRVTTTPIPHHTPSGIIIFSFFLTLFNFKNSNNFITIYYYHYYYYYYYYYCYYYWQAEASPPLFVELSKISLYLYIYIFIYL